MGDAHGRTSAIALRAPEWRRAGISTVSSLLSITSSTSDMNQRDIEILRVSVWRWNNHMYAWGAVVDGEREALRRPCTGGRVLDYYHLFRLCLD